MLPKLSHSLLAHNQPYLVLPIRNLYYPAHTPTDNLYSSIQPIWPNWTSFKSYAYMYHYKVWLIYHSLILSYLHTPDYTCSSTTNSCYTKPEWILVSHLPDDVITISTSTSPDVYLDDDFSPSPVAEILQLLENMKHTHARCSWSLTALWQWCKQCREASKSHQSNCISDQINPPRWMHTVKDCKMQNDNKAKNIKKKPSYSVFSNSELLNIKSEHWYITNKHFFGKTRYSIYYITFTIMHWNNVISHCYWYLLAESSSSSLKFTLEEVGEPRL